MTKHPSSRVINLSKSEVDEFLNDHLPYRIKILRQLMHYEKKGNEDIYWPSIYESGQIVCRMFIQFLGLGIDRNGKLKKNRNYFSKDGNNSYEVKIIDLGGKYINVEELEEDQRDLLEHAYEAGNVATAHLTYKTPFVADPRKVIQAAQLIIHLLENNLNQKFQNV